MRRHSSLSALLTTACFALAIPGHAVAQSLLQHTDGLFHSPSPRSARPTAPTGIVIYNSQWTAAAPTLDGTIGIAEWSNASVVDISFSATPVRLYLMNDANYLYIAIDNQADAVQTPGDHEIIVFDDEGGAPPSLGDGTWNALVCPATEGAIGLGDFSGIYATDLVQQGVSQAGFCTVEAGVGVSGGYSVASGHMVYEMRIDLSTSLLNAQPGQNFGAWIASYDADIADYSGETVGDPFTPASLAQLFLATPALAATNVLYGTQGLSGDLLVTIDPATGVATSVGSTGQSFSGLAVSPAGEIFATTRSTGVLYRLDAATGQASQVGPTGVSYMDAIAFDRDGDLWGIDNGGPSLLYSIDPGTGVVTPVGPVGTLLAGLAFDPIDGTAYASGAAGNDMIYRVDLTTGTANPIGSTGLGGATPDICFDVHGNLFGVKGGGLSSNNLIAIDKTTGAGSVIGATVIDILSGLGSQAFLGLAQTNVLYATQGNNGDQLATIDPLTGVATSVGNTGLHLSGLAVSSAGELLATTRINSDLYRLDAATGDAYLVGPTGVFYLDAIAFDRGGHLWGINNDGPSTMFAINPATAAASPIGETGAPWIAGLAFDPNDGKAYASDGNGLDGIYTVSTVSGAATLIGHTGLGGSTPDIGFDVHGRLFGVFGGGSNPNTLFQIDKTTGAPTVIGATGIDGLSGLGSQAFLGLATVNDILGSQGNAGDQLIRIDPGTGMGSSVGHNGVGGMSGLAVSPEGHVFTTSTGNSSSLYRVDAATGEAYLAGPTGTAYMSAIAFDSDGNLWGLADTGPVTLYRVNAMTGAVTPVGPTGEQLGGMAFDPTTGELYASSGGASPVVADAIYRVNTSDGSIALVGTTGLGSETPDICFDPSGQMYGVKSIGGGPSNWISIDKSNGSGATIGPVGFNGISGLGSGAASALLDAPRPVARASRTTLDFARPNPFSTSTELRFALQKGGPVEIDVYNVLGQRVRRLVNGPMEAGEHVVRWSGLDAGGRPVGVGMYYVQMRTEGGEATRAVVRIQ
jgi:streptogramin lyase